MAYLERARAHEAEARGVFAHERNLVVGNSVCWLPNRRKDTLHMRVNCVALLLRLGWEYLDLGFRV